MKQFEFGTLAYVKSVSNRKVFEFENVTKQTAVTIKETDWRKVVAFLGSLGWEIKHVENENNGIWFQRETEVLTYASAAEQPITYPAVTRPLGIRDLQSDFAQWAKYKVAPDESNLIDLDKVDKGD